jgi:flagellar biosynthesis/type III secretory pathway protein FliH
MRSVLSGLRIALAAEPRTVGRPSLPSADTPTAESAVDLVLRSQEQEILALRKQLDAALQEQHRLRDAQTDLEKSAFDRGFDAGRDAGREEIEDRQRDRLARLSEGVAGALELFEAALNELAVASESIACAAVEKVLGHGAPQADAVRRVIARQLAELRDALPLKVRVSAQDFDDAEPLVAEIRALGSSSIKVECDPALHSGACRIELQLGEVDADVSSQLAALRALLIGGVNVDR